MCCKAYSTCTRYVCHEIFIDAAIKKGALFDIASAAGVLLQVVIMKFKTASAVLRIIECQHHKGCVHYY